MPNPEPTSWTVHLAAQRPARMIGALLLIILALSGVAALAAPWGPGGQAMLLLLTGLLLVGAVAEFLLPVTFTLDDAGAHMRLPVAYRLLPWARVRRVYLTPHGIKLSPLTGRSWVESYRGILLRAPDRDRALDQVRAWLDAAGVKPEYIEEP